MRLIAWRVEWFFFLKGIVLLGASLYGCTHLFQADRANARFTEGLDGVYARQHGACQSPWSWCSKVSVTIDSSRSYRG